MTQVRGRPRPSSRGRRSGGSAAARAEVRTADEAANAARAAVATAEARLATVHVELVGLQARLADQAELEALHASRGRATCDTKE
jgi:hypothetical protein